MTDRFVAAIDQGTTSSRCFIFDGNSRIVAVDQREHHQIFPRPGWVEHDALEIWARVQEVLAGALAKSGLRNDALAAIGITNQRETTVIWDRRTGRPIHHAITWQDTRTDQLCAELAAQGGADRFASKTGLRLASYFSAAKIRWLLDHVAGSQARAERGELLFGTMDSWLIWNMTRGAVHVTDVTNASRTLLMDLETCQWDEELLRAFDVPATILPEIRSSAEVYGRASGLLDGTPIAAALGDQHAALFGQTCFGAGEAKGTYGTGSFILLNTGDRPMRSSHGLLSTVGFRLQGEPTVYAIEGSIANTGSMTQWLRDKIGLISTSAEIETLAAGVEDSGGCYFVPAFSGLFAPHWRPDARGVLVGLTGYVGKEHLARAVLEATAWQTKEVIDAMALDSGQTMASLRVDGGMTSNNLLMQMMADILDMPVTRPFVSETTCLGAAHAAGLVTGVWADLDALRAEWRRAAEWVPNMDSDVRKRRHRKWVKAVEAAKGWIDSDDDDSVRT
jgi:glycerol kinase